LFLTEWSEIATVRDYTLHITDVLFGITMTYCLAGAIESLDAKWRRALKTRGHLPNDDAATKLLFLLLRHAAKT
jgi:putative transposase